MRISDWSSDVCSSDLAGLIVRLLGPDGMVRRGIDAQARRQVRALVRQHHVRLEEVAVLGGRALHVERREAARVPAAEALQIVEPEPLRPQGCAGRAAENVIRSEEHTSELQSLMRISYAVFCLKKKKQNYYKRLELDYHTNE